MADVVQFKDKVIRVCHLNRANDRPAPTGLTELVTWLGLGAGSLSKRYALPTANLHASLERAVVMALGFGPTDAEFRQYAQDAWSRWLVSWGPLWRDGGSRALVERLETSSYFVPRLPDDPLLTELLRKIRRSRAENAPAEKSPTKTAAIPPRTRSFAEGRYLDRLASLQVVHLPADGGRHRLLATCTFGQVEIPTEDATYLVSINRCHAELYLTEASFDPLFEETFVDSRTAPITKMKIGRETSKINHPTWVVCDSRPKTALWGEYCDLELGIADGEMAEADEARLLVSKAGFAVSALSGPELQEGGILASLLKYLVTEHVGEIEQRNSYLYYLSAGPILGGRGK